MALRALRGLGDFLVVVPALRAIKTAWPDSSLTLISLPEIRPLAARFTHWIDEFLDFPGWPGIPEVAVDPGAVASFLLEAQRRGYDLALQLHGSGLASNGFVQMLGAEYSAGFHLAGHAPSSGGGFLPYRFDEHEVLRWLRLAAHVGAGAGAVDLEFPLSAEDEAALGALRTSPGLPDGPYACLHPGSAHEARRWSAERFAEVGDGLSRRGLEVVITGSAAERDVAAEVHRRMRTRALDLAGETALGTLGALIRGAAVLVCNDTGVSHLAGALGVPSVIVFRWSDRRRWAPLDGERHRALGSTDSVPDDIGCPVGERCLQDGCALTRRDLSEVPVSPVTAADVLREVDDLVARFGLGNNASPAALRSRR